MQIPHNIVLKILTYLIAITFSLKCIPFSDFWWQLHTGDFIRTMESVPHKDPFSYTFLGSPWTNIPWLSEYIFSIWNSITSVEFIPLLQAIISCAIVYIIYKIARLYKIEKKYWIYIFLLVFLNISEYRYISHPEMYTHLFTLMYIYIILKYLNGKSKYIYALVPLQILWQNLHEAYGIGIITLLILIVSISLTYKNKMLEELKPLIITLIAMIACTGINPYGYSLLPHTVDAYSQIIHNGLTIELKSIITAQYWDKTSYLFFLLLLVASIAALRYKTPKLKGIELYFYPILAIGFGVLALFSHSSIILGLMACIPLVFHILQNLSTDFHARTPWVLILVSVVLYFYITTDSYYRYFGETYHYGIEILSIEHPEGSSKYMRSKEYKGEEIFSDYLYSSYFLQNNPDFATYIDGRAHNLYPLDFIKHYTQVSQNIDTFLHEKGKFDWKMVVLDRNSTSPLHKYLYNDSIYTCVYVDPLVAVYEVSDTYTQEDIFTTPRAIPRSKTAELIQCILSPWYTSYNYDFYDHNLLAAEYYIEVGRIPIAEHRLSQSIERFGKTQRSKELSEKIAHINRP